MSGNTLWPISFSGGSKSISDDDLCSECGHLDYQPGDMSVCCMGWPGLEDMNGYVQKCEQFQQVAGS